MVRGRPIGGSLAALLVITGGAGLRAAPQSFAVRQVSVLTSGQWRPDPNGHETAADCRRFRPTSAAMLRWFARSREVSKQAWLEELDWTQCSAGGTLVTDRGRTYRWEVDQAGRAQVTIDANVTVYLGGRDLPFGRP